ncbi:hypothetical protein CDD82_7511 [Ophiocordyceps australis]|uniref:Uncharacterized protein n=1 Tax=Ophiocordyceps australis TaxID=1399860 RepID=A0A2C5YQ95_9HYPO|nr:hypothetical protein CDD82_7511 [Ophiocordyceps australis]
MDQSLPKRRRVSPRATSTSSAKTAPPEASASRPSRPSFASPTKASLARHNPHIFERSRSRSTSPSKAVASRASNGRSRQVMQSPSRAASATLAPNVAASEAHGPEDAAAHAMAVSSPNPPSAHSLLDSTAARASSPTRFRPRPFPPPPPDGTDDLEPFLQDTLRQPHTAGFVSARLEPKLPPPTDDGVSSSPPKGIHVSPLVRKAKPKSSPLKPGPRPAQGPHGEISGAVPSATGTNDGGVVISTEYHAARRIAHLDGHQDKRRLIEELRSQISKLKSDIQTASKENERIHYMQISGRILASSDQDEVMNLLRQRLVQSGEAPQSLQSKALLQMALDPIGLLPWGRLSCAVDQDKDKGEALANIKSHHPVSMSADQELPFLQLFTPFNLTSAVSFLPPAPNQPLQQRQLLTLRSRDVAGLFTAKLELMVDAMRLRIVRLSVVGLEPSAQAELEPFVDKICSGKCNRSMQRNIGLVCWAMGDWYRVAVQRARLWQLLDQRLGTTKRILETVTTVRSRRRLPDVTVVADTADMVRLLGQQAFEINLGVASASDDEAAIRLEWKIEFDWTGEAQSRVGILVGIPGKWREADGRGVFAKVPKLFEQLAENQGGTETAASIVTALLASL